MIVELRQYTLEPGQRDTLVEIFEKHFIDTQEAVGITLIGLFHDLGDPDKFVWLRGFQDMDSRKAALVAFYEQGDAWKTHGPAANATMIDSDDVLLLRPVGDITVDREYGEYRVVISPEPAEDADPVMRFEPLVAENTYPRLPVRDEQMFVTVYAGGGDSGSEGLRLKPTARSAMR